MAPRAPVHISWFDRFLISLAPKWGISRVRARAQVRHFEAASGGRRTSGWAKYSTDANSANRPALVALRELARDLRRNNGWARRGVQTIVNNAVGWGIMPTPDDTNRNRSAAAIKLWDAWAKSTKCDFDGRLNFYGIQRLAMETIVEAGEVLIVRQAPLDASQPIPLRLQVLEPDYLDTSRTGTVTPEGNPIVDGIEFDMRGQRVAYWLYTSHPGGSSLFTTQFQSVRVPADRVLHIYRLDRPGQVRGVSWLAAAIARLKGLDDFEDAELQQQMVAACFGAFVENDGSQVSEEDDEDEHLEHLEPGHIAYLAPGEKISFANPPAPRDGAFSTRALRRIAVSLGITYEDLTGDYSNVNFSSARMARIAHWGNVWEWQEHMLIPQLCNGVWGWAMELVTAMKGWPVAPSAEWAAPPMPILEPDKEALAYSRALRIGMITWPQMIRELGRDPVAQLAQIAEWNKEFDKAGVVLDGDPRRTNSSGQKQQPPAAGDTTGDDTGDAADAGASDTTTPRTDHDAT